MRRKGEAEQEVSNTFSLGEGSTLHRPRIRHAAPGMRRRWPARSVELETGGDGRRLCIAPPRQPSPKHQPPALPAPSSPDPQGHAPGMAQSSHGRCPQDQPCPQHPHFQVPLMERQLFKHSLTVFPVGQVLLAKARPAGVTLIAPDLLPPHPHPSLP